MARKNLDTQNYGYVEGNDNSYSVLPEGEYLTSIYDVKDIEFAKRGGNAGRPAINVQFRLVDGRPHANRRLFDRVPMFATFAPKEGKEKLAGEIRELINGILAPGSKNKSDGPVMEVLFTSFIIQ